MGLSRGAHGVHGLEVACTGAVVAHSRVPRMSNGPIAHIWKGAYWSTYPNNGFEYLKPRGYGIWTRRAP